MVLVAGPKTPAQDLKGMLDYIAKNPGKVTAGHPGLGTYGHMTELAIAEAVKSSVATVPYKGTSQIIPDLLAGNIDLSCDQAPIYVNMHKAGQVKVIAVIADERSPLFPEVPTLKEAGINFTSAPWYGLEGPKGVPADIANEMAKAVAEVLKDPANQEKLKAANYQPKTSSPAEFAETIKKEVDTWAPVIRTYNLHID
jgi:tripartite-type tricarboxylate transporter receptor subunit TctC